MESKQTTGYTITDSCFGCGICQPHCPTSAIKSDREEQYQIETELCNNCRDDDRDPQCIVNCPISSPMPLQAKKGRYKAAKNVITNPDLFINGKNNSLASSIVIWEGSNVLSRAKTLPWKTDSEGKLYYSRSLKQGLASITFQITDELKSQPPQTLKEKAAQYAVESIDIRAACLHLIYAAYATTLERPWEQEFTISDRQIEKYLGLDKRKDLSKAAKLSTIKDLAQQPCKIVAAIDWPQQGKVAGFSFDKSRLWHLLEIKHHFQEDDLGYKHLIGLTFRIKPGIWAKYFLNKQGYKERIAYYQYGSLPKFLLSAIATIWQQHEGAARMMLWLLFKTKMGRKQPITIPKLMQVAYGKDKMDRATVHRDVRKRLLRTFEGDLETLNYYGIKPIFDPVTYKVEIQPLWAKLANIPEDGDAAVEFWINDANSDRSLIDSSPPGKWNMLMKARILGFDLPPEWQEQLAKLTSKKQRKNRQKRISKKTKDLSSEQILEARKRQGFSQRTLAEKIGKSQSWIRDLENGRLSAKPQDRELLRKLLKV
ncbi:MAG: helix-turn-helix domain-containing protein [Prochloraceae cyanobacterium]|nr:helix-turn-helix domain-containing protein [Prochloraceae cyanobacterium]